MATQQEQKSAATAVAPAPVAAEEFAQVLKGNFKPRTERAATEVENAIQTLVTQALADSSLVKSEVLDTIEEMILERYVALTVRPLWYSRRRVRPRRSPAHRPIWPA